MWRHLLSQKAFFTEEKALQVKPKFSKPRIPLFLRGSTFRCPTNRVLNEIENDKTPSRLNQSFERYELIKHLPRSQDEPWNQTPRQSRKTSQQTIGNPLASAENSTINFENQSTTQWNYTITTMDTPGGYLFNFKP